MSVKENLEILKSQLNENVRLVAVSKTKPDEMVQEAYEAGQRIFGENKVQDMVDREGRLPSDIQWHFIGHLQRNKVKYLAPFINTIQAVDSLRLLKEIEKHARANQRVINCFLQFHIALEESKFGLSIDTAKQILMSEEYKNMEHIKIGGVMGMATFTDDMDKVRGEFKTLRKYFDLIKNEFFNDDDNFCEISMGMSGDYKIAIEEGSTLIRVGTAIFGEREKH